VAFRFAPISSPGDSGRSSSAQGAGAFRVETRGGPQGEYIARVERLIERQGC